MMDQNKVLDLVAPAERIIYAALPGVEREVEDASRKTFALQIAREFEKIREPWPWLENRAAGAIGIGLSDIQRAHLPAAYRSAKAALREAERIDECRDWASKAEALASYARQARDDELFALAVRVRLRAIRRAGELIREINAVRGRPKLIDDGTVSNCPTRAHAAAEAGLSGTWSWWAPSWCWSTARIARQGEPLHADVAIYAMSLPRVQPIIPTWRKEPFGHPQWIFDFKYDGFRGLCYIEQGRCRVISRNGNALSRFDGLAADLAAEFGGVDAVIDGEVIAADETGRPQFYDLIRATRAPTYVAFDILWLGWCRPALYAAQ